MNSTLRTKLAAVAVLLVPAGALLATGPAAAAHRQDERVVIQRVAQDRRAPQIYAVSPTQGDRVSERGLTSVGARFKDNGTGINPRTVSLRVDGRNVTRAARVDGNDVRYVADLRPGRHTADVAVRDGAGNLARRSWTFNVVDHERVGYGYGHR